MAGDTGAAEVVRELESRFEDIAYVLDEIASKHGMKSDEMMRAVNASGSFAAYYGDWIRESWEGWEPIEVAD